MIDRRLFAIAVGGGALILGSSVAPSADVPPAKAYVVGEMVVKDMAGYRAYVDAAAPIIRKYGGTFLVRGGQTLSVEGSTPGRIVIIEFASLEAARRFEESRDYIDIAPLRHKAADSRLFVVEGTVAPP